MAYDFVIVGAGLFGCVFAERATAKGKKVLVIDQRNAVGGNCYTGYEDGIYTHDYGAHIFHTNDREVWEYVQRFAVFFPYMHQVVVDVGGAIYPLPFNMNTYNKFYGDTRPRQVAERLRQIHGVAGESLEDVAVSQVGKEVFSAFIKGYTEKQWGRKCSELEGAVIKRIPVRLTYDNRYFTDLFQGLPLAGYTTMCENMLGGVDVKLSEKWDSTAVYARGAVVIYTGAIDAFYGYSRGKLAYRSLSFRDVKIPCGNYQGCAVMNFADAGIPFTRCIEHVHLNPWADPSARSTTKVTFEYPCEWSEGAERYYPVRTKHNLSVYRQYTELAEKDPNIIFCGRLGEFKYYDMDDTVRKALNLAEKVC